MQRHWHEAHLMRVDVVSPYIHPHLRPLLIGRWLHLPLGKHRHLHSSWAPSLSNHDAMHILVLLDGALNQFHSASCTGCQKMVELVMPSPIRLHALCILGRFYVYNWNS